MKKGIILLVIAVCILGAAALLSLKLRPGDLTVGSRIDVTVDPRIELLAAVQLLSGYDVLTRFNFRYKRDVAAYFAPYKDHRAVKLFAEMSTKSFSYDASPRAMVHLSAPPDLRLRVRFTEHLKTRAGGEKQLMEFVEALRDFAEVSKFETFYEAHEDTYQALIAGVRKEIKGTDWVGDLEGYYGTKQAGYTIILAPLFMGAYGPRVERTAGKYEVYNICGPMTARLGRLSFGTRDMFRSLVWHEFGHSFVNPPWEKYQKELAKYSSLFDPIAAKMQKQAYGNWSVCVNEHIVRAVEVRLTHKADGKRAADKVLRAQKKKGFVYIEALCRKLEEYEKQRDKYPTFESFYPELVAVFKSLSEQKLAPEFYAALFRGPINAVSADKESVVLIVPTHENDTTVQNQIHAYVNRMRDRLHKNSPVLTDDEALKQDLSDKAVVAYGTMTGNSWLASLSGGLPFKIEPKQVVADTAYPGQHLRFITAWPNPRNPKKGILIYTAQQAADVVGINSVFHGPTDYVVARDKEVLKAADYVKKNGRWTFE